MAEATGILNFGMVIFFIALFSAISIVVWFSRKKLQLKSDEELQRLAKGFSVTLLIFNLCLISMYFLAAVLDEGFALLFFFLILIAVFLSTVIGPSLELLGLYFSICNTKRVGKKGIKYIVASSVAMIISLALLAMYLGSLIPLALMYYDII